MSVSTRALGLGIATATLVAGCSDGAGPAGTGVFRMNVMSSASAPVVAGDPDTIVVGSDTLVYSMIELVLREVEFDRVNDDACDDLPDSDDDFCEKFETGPILLDLPLGPGLERAFEVAIDTGSYDEMEIDIHKPRDDTQEDRDFANDNPEFSDISIRVTGTYNGADFVYVTDLRVDQEKDLSPPTRIEEAGNIEVTLVVDISGWFVVGSQLVDPVDALKGRTFENAVRDNIKASIEAFEDADGDGHDDHDNSGSGSDDSSGPGLR